MVEKFYIVTNEKFLKEIEDFKENERKRNEFIKEFFQENGIVGSGYYISGDGFANVPFKEKNKENIFLYIDDCEENNQKFGKQLLKPTPFGDCYLRRFRKGCFLLKKFQDECVENEIVINSHFHREGDYFDELVLGGYSVTRFSYKGKYYLRIEASKYDSITPAHDGFEEIKGSEFYVALERYEDGDSDRQGKIQ